MAASARYSHAIFYPANPAAVLIALLTARQQLPVCISDGPEIAEPPWIGSSQTKASGAQQMDGWIVTVAVFKEEDDEAFRHVTYVVAVADPAEAVRMTIADCGAKAAMLNCPIEEEQLQRLGLKPGELALYTRTRSIRSSRALVVTNAARLISFSRVRFMTLGSGSRRSREQSVCTRYESAPSASLRNVTVWHAGC